MAEDYDHEANIETDVELETDAELTDATATLRRATWGLVAAVGGIALVVVVGLVFFLIKPEPKHVISGAIAIHDSETLWYKYPSLRSTTNSISRSNGSSCNGGWLSSGYTDMQAGTNVTVKNEHETVIATGSLDQGKWLDGACALTFSIADVPKAKFYAIEVSHRGEQRYSYADLKAKNFVVALTLGD